MKARGRWDSRKPDLSDFCRGTFFQASGTGSPRLEEGGTLAGAVARAVCGGGVSAISADGPMPSDDLFHWQPLLPLD